MEIEAHVLNNVKIRYSICSGPPASLHIFPTV